MKKVSEATLSISDEEMSGVRRNNDQRQNRFRRRKKAKRRNAITKYCSSADRELLQLINRSMRQEWDANDTDFYDMRTTASLLLTPVRIILFDEFGHLDESCEGSMHMRNMAGFYYQLSLYDRVILGQVDRQSSEQHLSFEEDMLLCFLELGCIFVKKSILHPGTLFKMDATLALGKIGEILSESKRRT